MRFHICAISCLEETTWRFPLPRRAIGHWTRDWGSPSGFFSRGTSGREITTEFGTVGVQTLLDQQGQATKIRDTSEPGEDPVMSHNSAEPSQLGVTRRIAVVTRESVIKLGRLLLGIIRRGLLDGWRMRNWISGSRPDARRMRIALPPDFLNFLSSLPDARRELERMTLDSGENCSERRWRNDAANFLKGLAPQPGLEPGTLRLTEEKEALARLCGSMLDPAGSVICANKLGRFFTLYRAGAC